MGSAKVKCMQKIPVIQYNGSFVFSFLSQRAEELARKEGIPRIYLAANSGARIGLAEEVKHAFRVAWVDAEDPEKVRLRTRVFARILKRTVF